MQSIASAATDRIVVLSELQAQRQLSPQECGELGRLLGRLSAVPRLSALETQRLVGDLSFLHSAALSLLFLQGDFGNCFYIVVQGSVALYVNKSVEKENENSRDIGAYRGLPLPDPQKNLEALGENVANLTAGLGFGEYALLSVSRRYRGASAVVASNSLLLVVPEQCYNSIFRRHHLRQQKMAEGLAIIEKHPFFSGSSYAKLVQIAFSMQCISVGARKQLVRAGESISSAFVIATGTITVYSPDATSVVLKKTPAARGWQPGGARPRGVFAALRLAVAQWGHGCMIGEMEVSEGKHIFGCSYETSSECELFEIPRASLEEVIRTRRALPNGPSTSLQSDALAGHLSRVLRASSTVHDTFQQPKEAQEASETLQNILPLLSGIRQKKRSVHRRTKDRTILNASTASIIDSELTQIVPKASTYAVSPSSPVGSRASAEPSSRTHRNKLLQFGVVDELQPNSKTVQQTMIGGV